MLPRRARIVIPPIVALAAWGVFVWACAGDRVADGDDFIAGVLAVVASAWALLDYYYRRSARDRNELRAEALENLTVAAAEGVVAFAKQETAKPQRRAGS